MHGTSTGGGTSAALGKRQCIPNEAQAALDIVFTRLANHADTHTGTSVGDGLRAAIRDALRQVRAHFEPDLPLAELVDWATDEAARLVDVQRRIREAHDHGDVPVREAA